MELVRNKLSDKRFIVVDEAGDKHLLLITPEGKVKRLERHLFDAQISADYRDIKWRRCLTKHQLEAYAEYEGESLGDLN